METCKYKVGIFKRVTDVLLSCILLVILSPIEVIIALIVKIDNPHLPVIFKQKRIGRYGREFYIYKFRTMSENAPHMMPAYMLSDDSLYISDTGMFLRLTKLDELPQLFNVLKGDMSFIGPRPLIKEEGKIHNERLVNGVYSIRPGITGLAQINGGNTLNDREKLKMDLIYLSNYDFSLDIYICVKTVTYMLKTISVMVEKKRSGDMVCG